MIKKVVIEVGGKEIELTETEAINLHGHLDRLFGSKRTEWVPYVPYVPPPEPTPYDPYRLIWSGNTWKTEPALTEVVWTC